MFKLVVLSALIAVAVAKPSGISLAAPLAYGAPIAPVVSKTITYASEPVVTGYSSTILKPQLEAHAPIFKTATLISEPSHIEVREPVITKVGAIVQSVPTAISHQSSTIVHSKANVVTPILAPAIKTYSAPIVKTIAAEPIIKTVSGGSLIGTYAAATPLLKTYTTGPIIKSYAAAPIVSTYAAAAPLYKSYGAYSAPILRSW